MLNGFSVDVPSLLSTLLAEGKIIENVPDDCAVRTISSDPLSGKIVALYFSAHWCPPCRGFTPRLACRYQELKADGHPIEIIFVSSDSSEAEALEYFHEMPWKMLNFASRTEAAGLKRVFGVSGIPSLILLDESMKLITANGREAIMNCPFANLKTFESERLAQAEALTLKIASLPEESIIDKHPHPLKKLASVYRGQYGCDVCGGSGTGWVYHCDQCGYDAHPKCACPAHFH